MKEEEIRPQQLFNRYLELSRQDIGTYFSDRTGFVEVGCPACSSRRNVPGLTKFGFDYVSCSDCASLYVSPRPTLTAIDDYYRKGEAVRFWSTDFFRVTAESRRERIFRPRASLVAEWVRKVNPTGPHGTFVDVGCGYGIFLEEVARLSLFQDVVGIEPAPGLATVCRERGFHIIEDIAERASLDHGRIQASFVSAFELLEHLFAPDCFLLAIRQLLQPGGMLLFTTLTVSGFDLQVLWEHSKSIYPPHHLNLLSVEGMEKLVSRCGFDVLELSTPGELDVDIVRNIAAEQPGLELPRFVRQLLQHPLDEVRTEFQRFLKANRLSSHIRVIARRPVFEPSRG